MWRKITRLLKSLKSTYIPRNTSCSVLTSQNFIPFRYLKSSRDFPGGAVVKNPPANAGHGYDPWSGKISHATEQLRPCATTAEARAPRALAPQQEKPPQ